MFHTAARRFIQFNSPIGRINPVVATRRLYGTQQTDVDTINVMPETPIKLVENGEKTWTTDEIFKGKKVVVFGIPIPFSPVCQNTHCPSYVLNAERIKKHGVDSVVCISVADFFAMSAFAEKLGAKDKVLFLADPKAEFSKQIKMDLDLSEAGFGMRSKRYSMVVDNGKVKFLNVEDVPSDLTVSSADSVIEQLKTLE